MTPRQHGDTETRLAGFEARLQDAFAWANDHGREIMVGLGLAILVGAIGDPRLPTGLLERAIIAGIRFGLDLYVNLRPIKLFAEALCPLKGKGPEDVDLVLINTCSVRATAENRAWGRIDRYAALKRERAAKGPASGTPAGRPLALVVTGCMAERMKDEILARQPAVDYVVGTFQKQAFGLLLDAVEQGRRVEAVEESPAFAFSRGMAARLCVLNGDTTRVTGRSSLQRAA